MPVESNVLERLLLYRLGRAPTPMLDLAGAGGLRAVVAAADLGDHVELRGGDYTTDDLGGVGDLGGVADSGDAPDALAPGGRILVMDQFEGSSRMPVARAGIGLVGLTYLATLGGRVYPTEEVRGWLEAAGFAGVERTGLRSAPGVSLLEAEKPE